MKTRMMIAAISATFFLAGIEAAANPHVPLVPREKLFGNPSRIHGTLSPDGKWLGWIAPRDGVLNIWVAPANDMKAARALTDERARPIPFYFWSPDSRQVLYVNDHGGDENFHLYAVDAASGTQRSLTPFDKTLVEIIGISDRVKDHMLIGLNNRDPKWHDVYSLDFASGRLTPVLINQGGYSGFVADDGLNLRIATRTGPEGGTDYFRVLGGKVEAQPFEQVGLEDSQTTMPISFTADGKTLYWIDSRGRDTAALIAQDLATGRKTIVGEDSKADVDGAIANPRTGRIEAYTVNYLKHEWVPVDPAVAADFAFLKANLPGQFGFLSRTDAEDKWILGVDPVTGPVSAWLYDRKARTLTQLYIASPELSGAPLAPMRPVEIRTRDGLTMVSYLTLPPGTPTDAHGRPVRPLPMVLRPHGGPWARDYYGYNGWAQWLANRGYAVLQPNFRGSTGYGKKFLTAGYLQWGGKMQDDLIDAVDWAIANGVTARGKVAIMGISYGGYATLAGLAFTPDEFACGVDVVGPSDLNAFQKAIPAYWESDRALIHKRMGDPTTPQGREMLRERSPLFSANRISKPLLIGEGANDPRVNINQSQQIVDALKARNVPVTYIVFPDEGHGFARPQNIIAFNAVAENFLARCLGGRAEPIGASLKASTAKVVYGAEFVPGLKEAAGQ
ncbi:MAG TPA: S9 family peptidase [Allosphingosinicella sp.]|nr:S9 family peptidase [Allosphingosinicella sp.]